MLPYFDIPSVHAIIIECLQYPQRRILNPLTGELCVVCLSVYCCDSWAMSNVMIGILAGSGGVIFFFWKNEYILYGNKNEYILSREERVYSG